MKRLLLLVFCPALFSQVVVNNGAAGHTTPSKTGLFAAIPATCAVGEQYFATDKVPPIYYCSSADTWTQLATSFAGTLTYYLTPTASSIVGDFAQTAAPYSPRTVLPYVAEPIGTDLLQNWATVTGVPNLTFIPAGTFTWHIHALNGGGGNVSIYAEVWEVSATGVDLQLIGTTEHSALLTGTEAEYQLQFATADVTVLSSAASRIVTRAFAVVSGFAATVDLVVGGEADSHTSLPSNTVDVTFFVPYTGATQDLTMGVHGITAGSLGQGIIDFSASAHTVPTRVGTGVPTGTNCSKVGELFFQSDAAAGRNLWEATTFGTPCTWAQVTVDTSGFVPYTGATTNLNMGTHGITAGSGGAGVIDFSAAASTVPVRVGTGAPTGTNCAKVGDLFFQSDATPGRNLWEATAFGTPCTWTQVTVDTSGLVPYTGATTSLNMGAHGITAGSGGSGAIDFSGAASTVPVRVGTGAPTGTNCAKVGELFFQSDATAGLNLWEAVAFGTPCTWSQVLANTSGLVPYTGATSDINIGNHSFTTSGAITVGSCSGCSGGFTLSAAQGATLLGNQRIPPGIIGDSFIRPNDSDGNGNWVLIYRYNSGATATGGMCAGNLCWATSGSQANYMGITSEQLYCFSAGNCSTAGVSLVYLDALQANYHLYTSFSVQANANVIAWRIADSNNYFDFIGNPAAPAVRKWVSGSPTTISCATGSMPASIANNDAIDIVASGTSHSIYVNSVLACGFTEASLTTGTKAGVGLGQVTSRVKYFAITQ